MSAPAAQTTFRRDVGIIGGCGHVGLPLALTFADHGLRTVIYDIASEKVATVRAGVMPFAEEGGLEVLHRVLRSGMLEASDAADLLSECRFLVLVVGTPIDEHLNPQFSSIQRAIDRCGPALRNGQILILRSTVFPGTSEHIQKELHAKGLDIGVSFCPERVAQGYSIREFQQLPQIISAFTPEVLAEVRTLFAHFTTDFVELRPVEAEMAKLMTNAWRYIQFATVNQFYMIATEAGLDFNRILHACRYKYPRAAHMPGPGLTAGPCLVKDTMQLAAYSHNSFVLGHSAMLINEGLPYYLISLVKKEMSLAERTVGILGMAFKAESDDARDSLSYKLRKLLLFEARKVLCSDPYVKSAEFVPAERLVAESDVIFIGAPHNVYRSLAIPAGKKVVDVWNCIQENA